jgi:tetratricopeptide (TPR) repeat protein
MRSWPLCVLLLGCASSPENEPSIATVEVPAPTATENRNREALLALKDTASAETAPASSGAAASSSAMPSATTPVNAQNLAAARLLFQQGTEAFEKGDYPAARAAFEAAYSAAPNAKILFNIGQTALKQGERAVACSMFQKYILESKPALAPQRIAELKKDCPRLR